ncbi:MAG TPA: sigma-70 family RNA polymerase sigma factor [Actinopolymorphaceae bacterium]|jgi:RNA polymerase sigma-70 factor (ECF subfamily)
MSSTAASSDRLEASGLEEQLEHYRTELTGYCYRMLGSIFEAEDAVQETILRAWRALDRFEGRSALRSWLYRIATNVCLDQLQGRQRRARPMDLTEPKTADTALTPPLPEATWIQPVPDERVVARDADPAEVVVARDSIRLAFIAALQHLPPRQRAVLILRDVLAWRASEVAALLETSVASVNSALQRARATLSAAQMTDAGPVQPMDDEQQKLLARYVETFESYDIDSFVSLLHEDAVQQMPPYELWLRGPSQVRAWMLGQGIGCKGSRLIPTTANGMPAFGQYRPDGSGGFKPFSLHVVEISRGKVAGLNFFLDPDRLFPLFGLPPHP